MKKVTVELNERELKVLKRVLKSKKKETLCISCGNQERSIDDTGRCDSCRRELYERVMWMCDFD